MKKSTTRDLVLTALFAALTAVLSQIQLPIGPVPFNLAVLGAFLAGMLLPPAWAAASMGVYIFMGLVGIPVFAGFTGGPAILFGKTGGYILGYVCIALCTALAVKFTKNPVLIGLAMALGLAVCYTLGTAWFMVITGAGFAQSLAWCVTPFVLPDIAKGVCAYVVGKLVKARLVKAH